MTFYIENETDAEFAFDPREVISAVAEGVLRSEGCPAEEVCVNVLLTDSEGIRAYNRDYRDIDRETDVLSFPNVEYDTPADFSYVTEHPEDCMDPDTGELVLGDVILNVDRVRSQAKEYNHSERREMAFLVAHSLLHLCGYDHMEDAERLVMEEKQEAVLQKLGITRDSE